MTRDGVKSVLANLSGDKWLDGLFDVWSRAAANGMPATSCAGP